MLQRIESWLSDHRDIGPLLLRVTLGAVFFAHGIAGLFIYTPPGLAQFFGLIGIPLPLLSAWLLIATHLLGGAMLVLGLFTRFNGLVHAFVMGVATLQAHLAQGFFLKGIIVDAANGVAIAGGFEFSLTLALASLAVAFVGGGAWALERRLGWTPAAETAATAPGGRQDGRLGQAA